VGHVPAGTGQTELHLPVVAGDRDVQRLPGEGDRQGIEALQLGPAPVERRSGPGDVGDDQVERRGQTRPDAGEPGQQGRAHDGQAQQGDLGLAQPGQRRLAGPGGGCDGGQTLGRVGQVGAEGAEDGAHRIAPVAIALVVLALAAPAPRGVRPARSVAAGVLWSEGDGGHGGERGVGQGRQVEEVAAERPRAHGQHDVVDRGVRRLGHAANLLDGPRVGGEAPGTAHRGVEQGEGCGDRQCHPHAAHRPVQQLEGDRGHPEQVCRSPPGHPGEPEGTAGRACDPPGPSRPRRPRDRGGGLLRVGRQAPLQEPEGGHPVHHGVVDLGVYGEAVTLESLDEVGLPQGPVPVEQGGVQPGGELEQLPDPPRPGQGRVPDVVAQVDVVLGGPGPLVQGGQ
jgi:hypothetical protein